MTYFPMGTIDASNFNSTKYPGVCKPMNVDTLNQVVDMQQQLNRVAQQKGVAKIAPDGDIGPATVALVNKVKEIVLDLTTPSSTCSQVASNADLIANNARMFADTAGVPATVAAPAPPKPPSFITPAGGEISVPGAGGASASLLDGMSTTTMILLGVAVVGAGYFLTTKKGRR